MNSFRIFNRRQILFHTALILVYTILALVVLWPLPLQFGEAIIGLAMDPLTQIWVLCWNSHWLSGDAASYFDANICQPEMTTFAFHDPLLAQSLLFSPLLWFTGNPILGYNVMILLTYSIGGWGMFLLARRLGLSSLAAFAAGLLFLFSPVRLPQLTHLNILSTQWYPFCLLTLLLLLRRPRGSWLQAMGFTLFSLLTILSSFYHGLVWSVLVGVICCGFIIRRRLGLQHGVQLAAAGLVIAVVLSPFVAALFQVSDRYGAHRSLEENMRNSAHPLDFAMGHRDSLIYGPAREWFPVDPPAYRRNGEKAVFPGLVLLLLAAVGVRAVLRRRKNTLPLTGADADGPLQYLLEWRLLILAGVLGLVFSLGPGSTIPLPYRLIYDHIPGAQGFRVLARLVLVAVFAGSLLAGLGLDLARRRKGRSAGTAAALLLLALAFTEGLAHHQWITPIPTGDQVPPVYHDLAKMDDKTVLLELPTHRDKFYPMYYSTYHWRGLANGRAAYIPPTTRKLDLLTDLKWPDAFGPALLDHLLDTGVNTILVKRTRIERSRRRTIMKRLNRLHCLVPIGQYPNKDLLFRLDAVRGDREDTKPLPRRWVTDGKGPRIELPGEDAYQVSTRRPMLQSVVDTALCLYEPNQVRWLVEIPKGRWKLALVARGADHPDNAGGAVTLTVSIAGRTLLARDIKDPEVRIATRPLSISKTAHYPVNCQVQKTSGPTRLRLVLDQLRLVPQVQIPGEEMDR